MTTANNGETEANQQDRMAALDKNGIGDQEKQEVLMIAYSLKREILHG